MKHVIAIRGTYYTDLEKNVEEKIQEIQSKGNEIVNVTMGGRGNESSEDWVALVLYEEK
jgi:hypothetical protein